MIDALGKEKWREMFYEEDWEKWNSNSIKEKWVGFEQTTKKKYATA
tara:strand:+ start:589 stop:726 length:138 start_codon:yes stop_codon:yes gene_type:complete